MHRLITCNYLVRTRYRAPGYTDNGSCITRSRGILQRGRYWINTNAELVFSKLSYDRCTFFCLNFIELIIEGLEGCRFPRFLVLLYKVHLALASSLQSLVVKNGVWCIDILWLVPLLLHPEQCKRWVLMKGILEKNEKKICGSDRDRG